MTRRPAPPESAIAGTLFALLAQVCTAVFTAAVTLYLVRVLGPEGYGEVTLVLSVGALALVVADAALAASTARLAAVTPDDPVRLATVVSSGLRSKLVMGGVSAVGLVTLAGPIARAYGDPTMAWALRVVVLAVVAESLVMLWLVAFQAMRRISLNVRLYLVESFAEATAIVSLVALGAGVTGAVLGRGVGYAVGAAAGAWLMTRALGRRLDLHGDHATRREISGYARPLFVNAGAYSAYTQVDVQLVGGLLGRTAVGIYAAPLRLLVLLTYPGQSVANAVSPRMAGASPEVSTFNAALRWLILYQTALMAPVVLWAEPLAVLVLGEQYRDSATVLAAMAPYLWLTGISVLVSTTVNYLGQARRRIPVVLTAVLLNAALCVVLLPVMGVVGACVAMSVSYGVYVPLHLRICRESFPVPLRRHAVTVVRAALGGLAFAAVLALVGRTELSATQWLLGLVGGSLSYVTVLVATGELTPEDRRQLRSLLEGVHRPVRTAPRHDQEQA